MRQFRMLLCLAVLMAGSPMAWAKDKDYVPLEKRLSAEQQRDTGLDTLSASQLQKLNAILAGFDAALPSAPPQAQNAGTSNHSETQSQRPLLGFNEKPIAGRLTGTLTGWEEGTVFELYNGQQWKVLKGRMKLPKPMTNAPVKLVPGIAGRWFLQVSEDYPMARVYLIN